MYRIKRNNIEKPAPEMGLAVNESKTKYMRIVHVYNIDSNNNLDEELKKNANWKQNLLLLHKTNAFIY